MTLEELERRLDDLFGEEAAELDRRAIEVSGVDPVVVFERSEHAA